MDIEVALLDHEIGMKVAGILLSSQTSPMNTPSFCEAGKLFEIAYRQGLGYTPSQPIVSSMEDLREKASSYMESATVITSHIIRAFQCHQTALEHFKNGRDKEAVDALCSTREIAGNIAKEYVNWFGKIRSLDASIDDLISIIYQKSRNINASRDNISKANPKRDEMTTLKIKAFDQVSSDLLAATNAISRIRSGVLNVQLQVEKVISFANSLGYDDHLQSIMGLMSIDGKGPAKKPLSEPDDATLQKEYEESYAKWLALAQLHLTQLYQTREALDSLNSGSVEIAVLQSDPLAMALSSSVKS